jgi:hypothetical protein
MILRDPTWEPHGPESGHDSRLGTSMKIYLVRKGSAITAARIRISRKNRKRRIGSVSHCMLQVPYIDMELQSKEMCDKSDT